MQMRRKVTLHSDREHCYFKLDRYLRARQAHRLQLAGPRSGRDGAVENRSAHLGLNGKDYQLVAVTVSEQD